MLVTPEHCKAISNARITLFILVFYLFLPKTGSPQGGFLTFPLRDSNAAIYHGWYYSRTVDKAYYHEAIDVIMPAGIDVLAAADGMAMASCEPPDPKRDTYGNFILIDHQNGYSTLYAHLSSFASNITPTPCDQRKVKASYILQQVRRGDVVGKVGKTGTTYNHLHFEVALNNVGDYLTHISHRVDPYAISNTAPFYPPKGQQFTSCPQLDVLWTQCPPVASSLTVSYTSRNAFNAAAATAPDPFDSLPSGTVIPNGSARGGITYSVSDIAANLLITTGGAKVSNPNALAKIVGGVESGFFPADIVTLTFATPLTAFGISFNAFGINNGVFSVTTDFGDVALSSFDPFFNGGTGHFAGFTTNRPVSKMTIRETAGNNFAFGLDELRVRAGP